MVLIGLGSNQGQSVAIMQAAIEALERFAVEGTFTASNLWRTSPVDCPPGSAPFLNAAVGFDAPAHLSPETLLHELKALEKEFGRGQKIIRNAPRELDLDLLVFNEEQRQTADFVLPHPRATDRLFVLAPLAEIAPDLVWPGLQQNVADLLSALDTEEEVALWSDTAHGA
ncbi:MAG: 2-amino-4-hydroxy-6-hydroxymethyldihydropteridine diphosphokinase [bacterium]